MHDVNVKQVFDNFSLSKEMLMFSTDVIFLFNESRVFEKNQEGEWVDKIKLAGYEYFSTHNSPVAE